MSNWETLAMRCTPKKTFYCVKVDTASGIEVWCVDNTGYPKTIAGAIDAERDCKKVLASCEKVIGVIPRKPKGDIQWNHRGVRWLGVVCK